jgi:SanA protein
VSTRRREEQTGRPGRAGGRRRRVTRIALWGSLATAMALVILTIGAHLWIVYSTQDLVYDDIAGLPSNEVGLVLGMGRYDRYGRVCPHFDQRVAAAAELYRQRKIRRVMPSGVGGRVPGDPLMEMLDGLVKLGVPAAEITLDTAGDRTLDSVVRAKEVFGLRHVTLITQRYHCYRAVYLARHYGLDAVAYCAGDEAPISVTLTGVAREYLAQVKAMLDLYVLHTQPRHPLVERPGNG